jgi:hypothetical protein
VQIATEGDRELPNFHFPIAVDKLLVLQLGFACIQASRQATRRMASPRVSPVGCELLPSITER